MEPYLELLERFFSKGLKFKDKKINDFIKELNPILTCIGVEVEPDGNVYYICDEEKVWVCDTLFLPCRKYMVNTLDKNDKYSEVMIFGINKTGILAPIKLKIEGLSNDRWFLKTYSDRCHMNVMLTKAYKIIEQIIRLLIKQIDAVPCNAYIGWSKETDYEYIFGNEVITKNSNIICLSNKKNEQSIPHESISEYALEVSDSTEKEANMFMRNTFLHAGTRVITQTSLAYLLLSLVCSLLSGFSEKPSFTLVFRGLSGSHKSSWLIAVMHVLTKYRGRIMCNFIGTVAGILDVAMKVRDSIFSVDDLFPCSKKIYEKMAQIFIYLLRVYGDTAGRVVYGRKSCAPSNLLVVTCEELPQNLAPSDYARLFVLTFSPSDINLNKLTDIQNNHATYSGFIKYYIRHIASLGDKYVNGLYRFFKEYQKDIRSVLNDIPDRSKSAGAWLLSQYKMFLEYQIQKDYISKEDADMEFLDYSNSILEQLKSQFEEFQSIDPSSLYCKAILELVKRGDYEIHEINVNYKGAQNVNVNFNKTLKGMNNSIRYPEKFLGFKFNGYYYLINQLAHKAVKQYCDATNLPFPFSERRIIKVLSERGLLCPENDDPKTNTVRIIVNGIQHRCIKIAIQNFSEYAGGAEDRDDEV